MDRVDADVPFSVVIDYAHTPDALENVLKAARPLTKGRLICVLDVVETGTGQSVRLWAG